jgi:hypothetical protein
MINGFGQARRSNSTNEITFLPVLFLSQLKPRPNNGPTSLAASRSFLGSAVCRVPIY